MDSIRAESLPPPPDPNAGNPSSGEDTEVAFLIEYSRLCEVNAKSLNQIFAFDSTYMLRIGLEYLMRNTIQKRSQRESPLRLQYKFPRSKNTAKSSTTQPTNAAWLEHSPNYARSMVLWDRQKLGPPLSLQSKAERNLLII
ncbi:hypothetical protein BGZ46_005005 [Entomortierella lignicola]|nr:hypothetical protein BGZ46_005005 [Entomortierella lignicola]